MSNHIFCISCKTVIDVNENNSSFSCVECGKDQVMVTTRCDEPLSNKRFVVSINESETECPTCKFEIERLSCYD